MSGVRISDGSPYGGVAHLGERLNGIQEVEGSIPFVSTKKMPTLDTIGRNADGIGLFRGFSPSNFTGETKDPNGVFTEAGWIRTPKNSLEIYSALFKMGFSKRVLFSYPEKIRVPKASISQPTG